MLGIKKAIMAVVLLATIPAMVRAQDPTPADVERYVRVGFDAWSSGDAVRIVDAIGSKRIGFGYRTRAPRVRASRDEELAIASRFLASVEYFRITEIDFETAVDGDVGLAWGFFTEEFQLRGGKAERVRVRFTMTVRRETGGRWRQLLYHRDTQPFDTEGLGVRAR